MTKRARRTLAGLGICAALLLLTVGLNHAPASAAGRRRAARVRPCAQFFGGQTSSSPYALMWQWSGGGGFNGDLDTIDSSRQG